MLRTTRTTLSSYSWSTSSSGFLHQMCSNLRVHGMQDLPPPLVLAFKLSLIQAHAFHLWPVQDPELLFVLALLVREFSPRKHEFSQLPSHHLLRDVNFLVRLAVVDCEFQTNEVREDGSAALLRLDHWATSCGGKLFGQRKRNDVWT